VSSAEREQDDIKPLQKFQAGASQFQGNPAMMRIYQEKLLDFMGLTPDQQSEVLNAEKQKNQAMLNAPGGQPGQPQPGQPAPQPQPAPMMAPQPA
jgi:hypothetical protein